MARTRESCYSIHASVTVISLPEPARVLQRAETELHHSTRKWQGDHSSFNSMFSSAPHCAMLLRAMIVKKLPVSDGMCTCNRLKVEVMGKVKHGDIRRMSQQNQSHNVDALEDPANEAGPGSSESAEEIVRVDTSSPQFTFKTQDSRINARYLDVFRRHVFGHLKDVVFSASKALRGNVGYALSSMLGKTSDDKEEITDRTKNHQP
ncbi:hypothetical protein NEUTE1DRAFT_112796 [Neurospora tetrasperma FGSC 2508]|uniref:Uncharacterized protein n=1 Tax=Neurospora tetrasperma (strain FGSC 2508 / ATCC MYA-4615 / P0657) TaxID=510951 RepID=F8MWZ5_NEUT8|nr:uncharacterized protein NEUTE1DRAFT_112796 [Neurospora tetrasperma FGSC 2508]EGO54266.1 hypothetical protein NEUTE1DRAFT_112796 [Neurospora tetrasperma FGSC 2508]EGZ68300.1 hypothetical protein NEUTE2DRAFT_75014 [Neurospora tetrasperma FGSC 2509]